MRESTASLHRRLRTSVRGGLGFLARKLSRSQPARALAAIRCGGLLPALLGTARLRLQASAPWLRGRGLEIGAGPNPQPLPDGCACAYYDVRTIGELRTLFADEESAVVPVRPIAQARADFPDGADFLIAHHVLEHAADPIGTLRDWHRLLRRDGIVVLSLPDMRHCADRLRQVATLEHLLLDHVLGRDQHTFDSREHIFSFISGWNDTGAFARRSKEDVAHMAHACATEAADNDCHWHAYDEALGQDLIVAAARLDGRDVVFENIAAPGRGGAHKTLLDLLFVYRLVERNAATVTVPADDRIAADLAALTEKLARAHSRLHAALILS